MDSLFKNKTDNKCSLKFGAERVNICKHIIQNYDMIKDLKKKKKKKKMNSKMFVSNKKIYFFFFFTKVNICLHRDGRGLGGVGALAVLFYFLFLHW